MMIRVRSALRDLVAGCGCLFRGLAWVMAHRRWWLFGLLPALISLLLHAAAIVWLLFNAVDVAAWLTPFADDWGWRDAFRRILAFLLVAGGVGLSVFTYTAVTLAIGEPFYEKLSEKVEEDLGGLPETADQPFWRTFFRSIRDSAVILGYMLMFTVPLFLLGFVPVIGQTVIPVIAALVEGFFLTAELTTVSMERRGILRKERFALLRGRMPAALGFGVPVFLASMLPLVNVILMPAIVAGATMLVRLHLAREPRSAGAIAA
ncbi:EI24 domain-containing protein [Thermobispora bispora]|jgi:CysZ protein|uniref:CysZ protein n=2 Tax=Thermobispora bispora TaxID=2006 RepID=D6Y4G9_THEBD|nr:protein of unknown function DUF540 [Thermobispora bispora DSM 43833]